VGVGVGVETVAVVVVVASSRSAEERREATAENIPCGGRWDERGGGGGWRVERWKKGGGDGKREMGKPEEKKRGKMDDVII
jgi:hypothetical protein